MTAEQSATAAVPPNRTTRQVQPAGHATRDSTSTTTSSITGHTAAPIWEAALGAHPGDMSAAGSHACNQLAATDTRAPKTNPNTAKSRAPGWCRTGVSAGVMSAGAGDMSDPSLVVTGG